MIQQRQQFPGYISSSPSNQPQSFSSNNPFRQSTASSTWTASSPFDEYFPRDATEIPSNGKFIIPQQRSHSEGVNSSSSKPITPLGPNILANSRQNQQRIMAMQSYSLSDHSLVRPTSVFSSNSADTIRRIPNPNRNTMYRKSTNPFIDDRSDDSFDEDDEKNILFPQPPPQRPPTSSKPVAFVTTSHSTRHRRSNSDSSLMEQSSAKDNHRSEHRDRDRTRERNHDSDRNRNLENRSSDRKATSEHRTEHRSDRSSRHRNGTSKSSKEHSSSHKSSSRKKIQQPLDVIDKLDVTGLFGPGSFHHDGPFDACTPHRNKNSKRAPVLAFPADGANNSISGADPNRDKYATENTIMGRGVDEAYLDYNISSARNRNRPLGNIGPAPPRQSPDLDPSRAFNPNLKELPVHGDLSMGLGSTTFLEGAPASREAIKLSVEEQNAAGAGGLGRKKSLVQRLRGNSNSGLSVPPRPHRYNSASGASSSNPELAGTGGAPVSRINSNPNPMETRTAGSSVSPQYLTENNTGGSNESYKKSPPTIHVQLDTSDAPTTTTSGGAGGLLRRVKSLKVGSRRRGS